MTRARDALGTLVASVLIVWNLGGSPVGAMLDGRIVCIVMPHEACRAVIPAGLHRFHTDVATHYELGVGRVPTRETTISLEPFGVYKDCVFPGRLIPDACLSWIRSSEVEPGGSIVVRTVTF